VGATPFLRAFPSAHQLSCTRKYCPLPVLQLVDAPEARQLNTEMHLSLATLQVLLPDIQQKLASMRPQLVARLAAQVEQLPGEVMSGVSSLGGCAGGVGRRMSSPGGAAAR